MTGAEIKTVPPGRGTLVLPADDAEREAVDQLLNSVAAIVAWGLEGWGLVSVAQQDCARR